MNEVDWLILVIIAFSAIVSLFRGFVKEAISLFLWLFAFGLSIALSSRLAMVLQPWVENPMLGQVISFIVLFLGSLLVGGMLGRLVALAIKSAGLGFFDRILGMAFGAVRGAIVVLVAVLLIPYAIAVDQQPFWSQSTLIPHFVMLEDWAIKVFSDVNQWRLDVMRSASS